MQKYGLMTYNTLQYQKMGFINLGDYIQSIAAKQFLPKVDSFIPRDFMNLYSGDKVKMIMNGWYMNNPLNFPPSESIIPLQTSIHVNSDIVHEFFNEKTICYLKNTGPIGCRDLFTQKTMLSYGIDAYFSGCLTLTLGQTYKRENITDDIYFVDVMFLTESFKEYLKHPKLFMKNLLNGRIKDTFIKDKLFNKYFSKNIIEKAIFMKQCISYVDPVIGLQLADQWLKRLCNAKLVVTSRIHVALPCLAMGTPVIFVNADFRKESDKCRFGGLLDLFNRLDYDSSGSSINFQLDGAVIDTDTKINNRNDYLTYTNRLIEQCERFING